MKKNVFLRVSAAVIAAALLFSGCETDTDGNTPVAVTGVALDKTYIGLQVNGEEQLTATVSPSGASNKKLLWESSDETKATVSQTGLVSALAAGSAVITVTTIDGDFTATCAVTVTTNDPVPVESVAINGNARSIVAGTTLTLNAAVTPPNATNRTIIWSSGDTAVATVVAGGTTSLTATVTGVAAGNATITATTQDGNKTATYDLTVTATTVAVTGVSLNETTAALVIGTNATLQLIAAITPPDATNQAVSWNSSFPSAATVNNSGLVTAVANGETVITVTTADGSHTATCTVTVSGGAAPRNYTEIEGDTLVHYTPILAGVGHFGSNLGTNNPDGSYTFDGTADQYSGGGAQYDFPTPGSGAAWQLSDYNIAEVYLKVTDGSVAAMSKKSGGNVDLHPYPSGNYQLTLNSAVSNGEYTYTFVIEEAGVGIGFQRNQNGPATVTIEKVVFSKGTIRTVTLRGGDHTTMTPIEIKIPDGRTLNFYGNYALPLRMEWADHTFTGWKNGSADFSLSTPITGDITLTAQWIVGEPEPVDMSLNLDPASWDTEIPPNLGNDGAWPTEYAVASYTDGKLTLVFDGRNRQKGVIPLSTEQVNELMMTEETGVTYRINGAAYKANGERFNADDTTVQTNRARFRVHLANPGGSGVSPGTSNLDGGIGDNQSVNIDNLVYFVTFVSENRTDLSFFVIQAMYDNGSGQAPADFNLGEPVHFVIESITIDVGDTTQ